jgi:hypothetical protein
MAHGGPVARQQTAGVTATPASVTAVAAADVEPLPGTRTVALSLHADNRGALVPFEFDDLPFRPRRVFVISGVPPGTTRGRHARPRGRQLLVCPSGRVTVELRGGEQVTTVTLDRPDRGLLVDAGVWAAQTYETAGAVLVVLASEPFRPDAAIDEPSP